MEMLKKGCNMQATQLEDLSPFMNRDVMVGGIVTEAPLEELAKDAEAVANALRDLGYRFANPIMSFSVLGLTVSPHLRITDRGYVDVRGGRLLPLFDDVRHGVRRYDNIEALGGFEILRVS